MSPKIRALERVAETFAAYRRTKKARVIKEEGPHCAPEARAHVRSAAYCCVMDPLGTVEPLTATLLSPLVAITPPAIE